MFKKKNVIRFFLACTICGFVALACTVFSIAWFSAKRTGDENPVDGEIGLRDYFYKGDDYHGDGSEGYPYEIVNANHLYNLTRLQNLGVFSSKKYFRVGHNFGDEDNPNIKVLDANGDLTDVLDLTSYFASNPAFVPIGNESTPFYGEFNGQLIPIKGLKVAGNPEDIGMFGYTAHTSYVHDVVCSDITVSSLGYTNDEENETNFLYSEIIEQIFSIEAKNFELATLYFDKEDGSKPVSLKEDSNPSLVIEHLQSNLVGDILKGKFVLGKPNIEGYEDISYSIRSSTGVIYPKGSNDDTLIVDLDKLPIEFEDETASVRMNSSISIVASVKVNGYQFSRVIQSYNIEIDKEYDENEKTSDMTLKVSCNFEETEDGLHVNASHGNNIGYIIGHCDGNARHCYVYNGTLLLNNNDSSLHNIETNSDTGLIGKIGNNVTTDISGSSGASDNKPTGVLNFSYVHSLIRDKFVAGDKTFAGYLETYDPKTGGLTGTAKTFVSYAVDEVNAQGKYGPRGTDEATFDLFKEYLRCDTDNPKHYITSAGNQSDIKNDHAGAGDAYTIPNSTLDIAMNSVDFTWNKVICDGDTAETKRGLGVFKLVTTQSDLANDPTIQSSIWRNNIGDFAITRDDNNAKTAIYYSTAECDWTKKDSLGNLYSGWNNANYRPVRMNTLPSYSNSHTFDYPFSRDFDYLFQIDLSEGSYYKKGKEIYNYLYNTDSDFLKNYFKSVLKKADGTPVSPETKGFGFKVQFKQDSTEPVTSLNSYLTVGQPGEQKQYMVNGEPQMLPPKTIVFHIDNPRGANISIAGCGGYISIYKYNPRASGNVEELYTMKSVADNNDQNYGRYFRHSYNKFIDPNIHGDTYSRTKSVVTPASNDMTSNGFLYGHTFTLPQGDYVIGSSKKMSSSTAQIYYVCVQGQTNGDLGDLDVATIGNYVDYTDFLLKDPTQLENPLDPDDDTLFAEFSFDGIFTTDVGQLVIDTYYDEETQKTIIRGRFNECITYLAFYCRKSENIHFRLNNTDITDVEVYEGPYEFTIWG